MSVAQATTQSQRDTGHQVTGHPDAGHHVTGPSGFRIENLLVTLALGAMVVLPLAEAIARAGFRTSLVGSSSFVRHLTLIVGMVGGVIAARQGRLLALSTLTTFLKGRAQTAAGIYSGAWTFAICLLLCVASVRFVQVERAADKLLALGIPVWIVQLVLPIGFGVIGLLAAWKVPGGWRARTLTLALGSAIVALGAWANLDPELVALPAVLALLVATALGLPIFATLAGVTMILLWGDGFPIATVPLKHYSLVTNPTLPAIPLFTLAGYFLAEGGASRRMMAVFQALFARFAGGPVIVTVAICAFFTSFTGASGVTILALGGLLMPVLRSANHSERHALGLLTGAGSLGLLFPPCLPLILYSIVANSAIANGAADFQGVGGITMEKMFLGGLLPGILLVVLTCWWGIRCGPQRPGRAGSGQDDRPAFDSGRALRALWVAKWELLLPVVALVALFGGFATPVEAAALTAFYAFFVETFVYRDLRIRRDMLRIGTECGLLIGGVLLILGVAMGFTNYLVIEEIPDRAVEWVTTSIHSRWAFLLALNLMLVMVGCLMDVFSATIVVVPLIVPLGQAFGIDPVHLGIIFLANLELGYLTPPVGMNLFLSSYRFGKPVGEVARAALPMLGVLFVGVLLITYVPILTTWLPGWLG